MSNSNKVSKSAIMIKTIKGKVASIIGWTLACFFGLIGVVGIFMEETEGKTEGVIFCLILMGIGIALIAYGRKTKNIVRRFKQYIDIISNKNETNIDNIAGIISQPVDFVIKDMQSMISKGFFVGAYLDINEHEIIFNNRLNNTYSQAADASGTLADMAVVSCSSCGAKNQIAAGTVCECEFCGSPIRA